jgi:hypothetical protein
MLSYVTTRLNNGDSFDCIAKSFHIEEPWLDNWLEENKPAEGPVDRECLSKLGVRDFVPLLEQWVQNRRELCSGEALCCAALNGDIEEMTRLLLEDEVPWDAEVREEYRRKECVSCS